MGPMRNKRDGMALRVMGTTRVMDMIRVMAMRVMKVTWQHCTPKGSATVVANGVTSRQIARKAKGKEDEPKEKEKERVTKAKERVTRKEEPKGWRTKAKGKEPK